MKKVGIVLLNMILLGALILFTGSILASKIAVNTITQEITGAAGAHRMMDVVIDAFPKADTERLGQVQKEMKNSPVIEQITKEYIDEIAKAAALQQQLELPDIEEDMDTLLEENMSIIEKGLGTELPESQKQDIKEKLKEKSGDVQYVLDKATEVIVRNTSGEKAILFKAYYVMTSFGFQAACLAGIVILMVLISLIKKSLVRGMFSEGITFMTAGIGLAALLPAMTERVGGEVADRILGNYININFSSLKLAGGIILAIGLVMELIYFFTGRRQRK